MNTPSRRETIIQFLDAMLQPEPCSCSKTSDKPECRCHIVDPSKNTILLFPCSDPKHSDSLIVKFNGQKFIAPPRKDKNGARYWKARDFYENEVSERKQIDQKETPDPWEAKLTKAGFTLEEPNKLVKSYQEKAEQKRPMEEFSMAEIKAYNKWSEEQEKTKEQETQSTEANPSPEIKENVNQ